jgi:hypothetical protein
LSALGLSCGKFQQFTKMSKFYVKVTGSLNHYLRCGGVGPAVTLIIIILPELQRNSAEAPRVSSVVKHQ